jgi:tetratricopeptide (TPR) repeat protein
VIAGILFYVGYNTVIKPYYANRTLINGLLSFENGASAILGEKASSNAGRLTYFKDALAYNTFGEAEINERLADVAAKVVTGEKDRGVIEAYVSTLDTGYKSLIAKSGNDPRPSLLYGVFLQRVGLYDQSIQYIDNAINMSPTKQSFYYQKGLTLIIAGRTADAVVVFKKAWDLLPEDQEARMYYGISLLYDGKPDQAKRVFDNNLDLLTDTKVIQSLDSLHMYGFIIEIAKMKIATDPNSAQLHVSLAAAYMKAGQNGNAIAEIRKAIELEPRFKEQGELYIKQIESGINPGQ